jgi:hypothetical protein
MDKPETYLYNEKAERYRAYPGVLGETYGLLEEQC